MKIGIIGINMYPKYLNFACGLHTYAFQQFFRQQGIEATVIDYKPVYFSNFDMRHPSDYYKKLYGKKLEKPAKTKEEQEEKAAALQELKERIEEWEPLYEEREVRYEKFKRFIDQYYIKTKEQYDSDLLEIKDPGFDCYMCVTDVIWNLLPIHTYDRGFLLGSKAMEGKRKISYAASRGVPKPYTQEEKDLFFHYIEDIDDISVREKSLKDFIEENSEKKAAVVLDPVMLHDKTFWQEISVKPKEQGYILLYYVMEKAADTIKRAVEYAKKHDLLIVELSDRPVKGGRVKDDGVRHMARYDVSMEEWLGYIEHADCIFTNSFHGCCFSILFEKLFYVGKRQGDKVTNILDTFGLQELRLLDKEELKAKKDFISRAVQTSKRVMGQPPEESGVFDFMPEAVDYEKTRVLVEEKRAESKAFLLDAVKRAEEHIASQEQKSTSRYEAFRKSLKYSLRYVSGRANAVSTYDAQEQKGISRYEAFRRSLKYSLRYMSGRAGAVSAYDKQEPDGLLVRLPSGKLEYEQKEKLYKNDGTEVFKANGFRLEGHRFAGWKLRIKIDTRWFWYMKDGTLGYKKDYGPGFQKQVMIFADGDKIPHIPVNRIRVAVAEANWKKGFF